MPDRAGDRATWHLRTKSQQNARFSQSTLTQICGHEKDTADRACGARGNATHHKPSSDVIRTRRRIIRHPHRRLSHVEAVALAKGAAGGAVVHDGWQIRGRARRGLAEILRPLLRRARVDLGLIEACGFAKARHAGRSLHARRLARSEAPDRDTRSAPRNQASNLLL